MSGITVKLIVSGLLFFISIVTGILMSYSGKPLNTIVFTIHKLTGITAVILAGVVIYNLFGSEIVKNIAVIILIVAGISVLALLYSGAMLSLSKTTNIIMLNVHRVSTLFAAVFSVLTIYFLISKK